MLNHHANNPDHGRACRLVSAGHVPDGYPAPVFILTERPNVVAARIERKRSVREAILAAHGTLKRAYLADLLDVAESYVKRCLSDAHRDEFNDDHLTRLGLAADAGRVAA